MFMIPIIFGLIQALSFSGAAVATTTAGTVAGVTVGAAAGVATVATVVLTNPEIMAAIGK